MFPRLRHLADTIWTANPATIYAAIAVLSIAGVITDLCYPALITTAATLPTRILNLIP